MISGNNRRRPRPRRPRRRRRPVHLPLKEKGNLTALAFDQETKQEISEFLSMKIKFF